LDSFEVQLTAQSKCIAEIDLKMTEMDTSKYVLTEKENNANSDESVDVQKIQKIMEEIHQVDSEIETYKKNLAIEQKKLAENQQGIKHCQIDVSTALENFNFVVTEAEFSSGSDFNLDADVQHIIDLTMIERTKMDDIMKKQQELKQQITGTTATKKLVDSDYEEAKKVTKNDKFFLSQLPEETFTTSSTLDQIQARIQLQKKIENKILIYPKRT